MDKKMKRKLDDQQEASRELPSEDLKECRQLSFPDFGLDSRLLQAMTDLNFRTPTLVQQKAIPAALDGQDVLARAKTGSGKTAAYLIPIVQSILNRKKTDSTSFISALILVPTRELANQVHAVIESLAAFCAKDVTAVKLSEKHSEAVQRSLLTSSPDVIVSTPARAWQNISSSALPVDRLTHLVLDEADLVMSYGYLEDLQSVARLLPKGVQTILMSATLTNDTDAVKDLFCRSPLVLNLEEHESEKKNLLQYYVKCAEDEKFLLAYVIYKLKLIQGKSIIFVADIDRCYRLKLFLEQFGIRSCVLNSELPVNSRIHVVEEFNRNIYDIIIASDEHEVMGDVDIPGVEGDWDEKDGNSGEVAPDKQAQTRSKVKDKKEKKNAKLDDEDGSPPHAQAEKPPPRKKQRKDRRDKEYGVSRGIDFRNVACVFNFDLPTSARSYAHRVGRTARAGAGGMALSMVVTTEQYGKHAATTVATAAQDERILARITRRQVDGALQPYAFDMAQLDAFRYRMDDALRAVTRTAVREARTRELRNELLHSDRLRRHFEENPAELRRLRHDGALHTARTQAHLRHVPDYLLPPEGRRALAAAATHSVPFRKPSDDRRRKGRKGGGGMRGRKTDPLKSFRARSRHK